MTAIGLRLNRHHTTIDREIKYNRPSYADDIVYCYTEIFPPRRTGCFYHIIIRGIERYKIFGDYQEKDKRFKIISNGSTRIRKNTPFINYRFPCSSFSA